MILDGDSWDSEHKGYNGYLICKGLELISIVCHSLIAKFMIDTSKAGKLKLNHLKIGSTLCIGVGL